MTDRFYTADGSAVLVPQNDWNLVFYETVTPFGEPDWSKPIWDSKTQRPPLPDPPTPTDKPWETVTREQIRHWRGSIASTLMPDLSYGPRPNQPDNVGFISYYPFPPFTAADRLQMIAATRNHGYSHAVFGPISSGDYHGQYPGGYSFVGDPDRYWEACEELWHGGLIPVVFLLDDLGQGADGNRINRDYVESVYTPIYQSARAQALCRVVCVAWEPSNWTAADWQWAVAWQARIFPNAYRTIHFPSGKGAPGRHSDLQSDGGPYPNEAALWTPVAPYIHGFQCQETHVYEGESADGRTPEQQFTYDLADFVRRFRDGYAGWPTHGADGVPIDVIAAEYSSYSLNRPYPVPPDQLAEKAIRWGELALSVDGVIGFGDGGPA